MSEQVHEPDRVAERKQQAEAGERQAVADGEAPETTAVDDVVRESGYSTEHVQGAAQPSPESDAEV